MSNPVRVPDEEEFERWKASQKKAAPLPRVPDEDEFEEWKKTGGRSHGIRAGVEQTVEAIRHPWETAKGMARSVVDDAKKAAAPVEGNYRGSKMGADGLPIYDGREGEKITRKNTPNAVTLAEKMKGVVNTGINAGFAVAPALSLRARMAVNAGLGAAHDSEDRVRGATAGLLVGEAAHGAGKVTGAVGKAAARKADVFDGAIEAGVKDLERSVNDQRTITHSSPRRVVNRPPAPVEPRPSATAVSAARPAAGRRSVNAQREPNELAITKTMEEPSVATTSADIEGLKRAWPRTPATEPDIPMVSVEQVAAMLTPDTPPEIAQALAESANKNAVDRHVRAKALSHTVEVEREYPPAPSGPFEVSEDGYLVGEHASPDLGEVPKQAAAAVQREPGPMRAQLEDLKHIEVEHGDQIRRAGFASAAHFVDHVARNKSAIYDSGKGKILVTETRPDGMASHILVTKWELAEDGHWQIVTAYPMERARLERTKKLLWEAPRNAPDGTGSPPTLPPLDPIPGAPGSQEIERLRNSPQQLAGNITESPTTASGETPKSELQPVSWPPAPEIKPVVSSNGEFQARPGVMGRVNRAEPALAGAGRLPEPSEADAAAYQPEGVLRLSPDQLTERKNIVETAAGEPQATKSVRTVARDLTGKERVTDEQGRFHETRTDNGRLRDFRRVSDDGLMKELNEYQTRMLDAQNRAQYEWKSDENGHFTDKQGALIPFATRSISQTSQQAKALQNLSDYTRIMKEIDAELKTRGHTSESITERQQELAELDDILARDAERLAMQDDEMADTDFDFGENAEPSETVVPTEKAKSAPREYLNYAKFGLDKTGEARVREAVERGRATGEVDKGFKSFDEQNAEAAAFAKELLANPLDFDYEKLTQKKLSGAEIVGMHSVVGENTRLIEAASRVINDPNTSLAERAEAAELFERSAKSTDELLSTIVRAKAQTARDLGFFRQIAKQSTDPEVWLVHAKKMMGDKPMPDVVMVEIRRLAREAAEACGGGA